MSGQAPPPGWHVDQTQPGYLRWWDGEQWTDHQVPASTQPAPWTATGPASWTRPTTNGFAIASMVLGIVFLYGVGSILAVIFGYVAERQIDRSGGSQRGYGMATAGILLGVIGVLLMVVLFAVASFN